MRRFPAVIAMFAIALVMVALPASAASSWYVDPAGSDLADCMSAATACQTLQAAVIKASDGDTINVAAGTYSVAGLVTVNKQLTLLGAKAGVDARTRVTTGESILDDSQGMSVSASGVVIDGFTVQGSVVAAYTGYGIWLNPGVSGTQVLNNIFQDNIAGLGVANAGPSQLLIQHNLFQHNNESGGAGGTGIYTDQYVGGAVTNVLIDANTFNNNANAGVGFSNVDTTRPDSNVEIKNNSFDHNGRGVYFYNTNTIQVHDNTIQNSTVPTDGGTSVAIAAFGDVDGLTILNNDLLGGANRGIRVGSFNVNPNANVVAHLNNIVGFAHAGLEVDAGGHVDSVNATCNWWGSATGPTNATENPGGTGDAEIGDAIFKPWLIGEAPTGLCTGGVTQVGKIAPTGTTCQQYQNGTAATLGKIVYTAKGTTMGAVSPGVFFYYTRVSGSAGDTVSITESHTGSAPTIPINMKQVLLYTDPGCATLKWKTLTVNADGSATGVLPSSGDFIISVKYNSGSLKGKPAPVPATSTYTFGTNGLPEDYASVDLAKKGS